MSDASAMMPQNDDRLLPYVLAHLDQICPPSEEIALSPGSTYLVDGHSFALEMLERAFKRGGEGGSSGGHNGCDKQQQHAEIEYYSQYAGDYTRVYRTTKDYLAHFGAAKVHLIFDFASNITVSK